MKERPTEKRTSALTLLLAASMSLAIAPSAALAETVGAPDAAGEAILSAPQASASDDLATKDDAALLQAEVTTVSGTWGTCAWDLDFMGTLTVHEGIGEEPVVGGSMTEKTWAGPFASVRGDVKDVVFEEGVVFPSDSSCLFINFKSLETVDAAGVDTSNVENMFAMFAGCSSLTSIDVSGWDLSNTKNMRALFEGCTSLKSLDASDWDTSHVEDMSFMFNTCTSLEELDVSGWDTSSVADMSTMFHNCSSLGELDVSGWDTSKVTGMPFMFSGCSSLGELDVSGWDTSSVTDMNGLFQLCSALEELDVSRWDTSKVMPGENPTAHSTEDGRAFYAGMNWMFNRCSSLKSLDLSGWDTSGVSDAVFMYGGCDALESFEVGERYAIKSADMFPEATSTYGWWSAKDGAWLSKASIVAGRSGVANIYLSRGGIFSDVTGSTAHSVDITWLAMRGISTGWDNGDDTLSFRPYAKVARADMAAFLFRLAKSWGIVDEDWVPSISTMITFSDVSYSTDHNREIWWLAESGISQGWTVGIIRKEFRPYANVARADMAAFIHRLALMADVNDPAEEGLEFVDVDADTAHADDIAWLAATGVSKGWDVDGGAKEFRPYANVARADMAAFLHRLDGLR